jgi:hypothetical protein
MIYEVAELRKLVYTHSKRVRDKYYDGRPANKKLLGIFPWWGKEPIVQFKGPEKIFGQPLCSKFQNEKGLLLEFDITVDAVIDFIRKNEDQVRVKEDGSSILKKEGEPASNGPDN